ncbi:hypothetical protein [Bacillus licheniformis]|uniref:hypothetical protein n=1 Tax=Bacillus licheniformis TaxID=1402 RepID=UPI003990BF43
MCFYIIKIKGATVEGVWIYGTIIPNKNMEKFKDFFNEDDPFAIEQYSEEWLDDENWFIIDEKQKKVGISLPGIYENDNEINWRWR